MAKFNEATQRFEWDTPAENSFDWTPYENGWNGKSLKANTKIKTKKDNSDKIYCHESYAQELYNKFSGVKVEGNKELTKNALVNVSGIEVVNDTTLMASINGGSNNVIIDLNKEQKFINWLNSYCDGELNKDNIAVALRNEDFKKQVIDLGISAKVTAGDTEKASIWDGHVESLIREMKIQMTENKRAYWATILSTNKGGFVVDIMNTITAFMPGSMAAANRVTDFEGMVGTKFEVMVESYDPNFGFVVSRKKYLKRMLPIKIQELEDVLANNKDTVFTGHVTGTSPFGVFVEIDEFITGMLHKTLVQDETREAMRNNSIAAGTEVQVYVHKIEKSKARENGKLVDRYRVILSDVPSEERDAVIARREAEEAAEKAEYENQKNN